MDKELQHLDEIGYQTEASFHKIFTLIDKIDKKLILIRNSVLIGGIVLIILLIIYAITR